MSALEIVDDFLQLLDGEKKYDEASKFLAGDRSITSSFPAIATLNELAK